MTVRDRLAIAFLLLTYPLVIAGLLLAIGTFRNDVSQWLAPNSPDRKAQQAFVDLFGVDEVIILSWDGCSVNDERLRLVEDRVRSELAPSWFRSVVSGESLSNDMQRDLRIGPKSALKRLVGVAIGQDESTTGLILRLNEEASHRRGSVIDALIGICSDHGLVRDQLRLAGVAHDLESLDREGLWSPLRAVPFIMLCSFLLAWAFLCRLDLATFVACLSSYVGFLSMTMVYLSGFELSAVVWTLPTLTMLLTMSASLHFLGYYRYALRSEAPSGASSDPATVATRAAFKPTLLCAITTAAGLFSLLQSETPPVQQFGGFGGICVLVSSVLVLWCLPAWLKIRPVPIKTLESSRLVPQRAFRALATHVARHRLLILLAFLSLMGFMAFQIPKLRTSVNIRNLFPAKSRVVTDAQWLERNFIDLSTVEVLLRFEDADPSDDRTRLLSLAKLNRQLVSHNEITGAFTPLTVMPPLQRERSGIRGVVARRTNQAKLDRLREKLPDVGLLRTHGNAEIWRVSLMVSNLSEIDRQPFERFVLQAIDESFDRNDAPSPDSVKLTGPKLVFDQVERQFLTDLRSTYLTAVLVIFAIVLLLVRSVAGCLLLTLPNVFPALLVLGAVALVGLPLDVASLMTASVALGIGVDDTLHYALWWRNRVSHGLSIHNAIVDTMHHCGTAMIQTSIVTGLSVSLYLFCGFLPTVRFGMLLSSMLLAALVGDLVLLPALLSLPVAQRMLPKTIREQRSKEPM